MSQDSVTLRPAWRNYWLGFLLATVCAILAVMAAIASVGNQQGFGWAALGLVAVAFIAFITILVKRYTWQFVLGSDTITCTEGIISRNQQTVRVRDLRSVELTQSVFQRLFGIGDLAFYSAGSDEAEVLFHGITQPAHWKATIYSYGSD